MWHARKPAISASVLIAFASATSDGAIMTLSYVATFFIRIILHDKEKEEITHIPDGICDR